MITTAPVETARAHMFAQFSEAFGFQVTGNRPLRLELLSRVTGHRHETAGGWTEDQYRWTARKLRDLAECPDAAQDLLRQASEALAPTPRQLAHAGAMIDACQESSGALADTDTALALLDRLGEVGHEARFAVGDAGLVLLAAAPTARPKDVLTEHLRGRERDQLRALLCPQFPPLDGLPLDEALRLESSAVEVWLTTCRVSQRVPPETRSRYPGLGYGFFRAAATIRQTRDGKLSAPTLADIERRLAAVADHEGEFRSPADLRRWIAAGEQLAPRETREKPDRRGAALAAFKSAFHELDSVALAWERVFGPGAEYRIQAAARGKA